ncbi:hypothetical protein GOP47_0009696 [Adiantum capillus-veneris]|uniref:Uncharacterized protein n=1 Tax=Adiantum capillus-veneris TaxID=13818 RepID=A0A9D4UXH5_ADICA|nr:hypothetical protein GOP47_0009696 [Adiantum capillus-veneris]
MGEKDAEVQRSLNLMEAMEDAMHDVKNYRTHCNLIATALRPLCPLLRHAIGTPFLPDQAEGARDLFRKFNEIVEDAVAVIRLSSTLTTLDKVLNQGEAKKRLTCVLESVQMISREMKCFLEYQSKRCSLEWKPFYETPSNNTNCTATFERGDYKNNSIEKESHDTTLPDLITFDDDDDICNTFHVASVPPSL